MIDALTDDLNQLKIVNAPRISESDNQDSHPALIPGPKRRSTQIPTPSNPSASGLQPRTPSTGIRLTFPPTLLTTSLLQIYGRRLALTRVPQKLHLAADIVSDRLGSGNERKWRIEFRNHGTKTTAEDGMRTVTLIIWEKGVEEFAAEIMVHLRYPLGETVSISWRFGSKYAPGIEGKCDDWQMFHFQRYFALEVSGLGGKSEAGTREIGRIELEEGESMVMDIMNVFVWMAVKTALGKGYEPPSREELQGLMERVDSTLTLKGIEVGKVVITRGFRKAENGQVGEEDKYFPSAFVEIHERERMKVQGTEKRAAAVIPIDVLDDGGLNLMGVIYEGEQPLIHYYRDKYPPPTQKQVDGAGNIHSETARA